MILRMVAIAALLLGIACIFIIPAHAAKESVAEKLKAWDPDNDGTVSAAELKTKAGQARIIATGTPWTVRNAILQDLNPSSLH
jgi:hypothetical protein